MNKQQNLEIRTAQTGFYKGFNTAVAFTPKLLIGLLILWAGLYPDHAQQTLSNLQNWTTNQFGGWYIYACTFFLLVCLLLGLIPKTAKITLGQPGEEPEFSNFTWFAMMFSAGLGVGMLTYSTAEPVFHFMENPETIQGVTTGQSADNVRAAFSYAYLHYGLTAWAIYGLIGLSLAYFCFNRGMPLTIRTALYPLFGNKISGPLGHVVDIVAILATIIGVGVTIGYGVSQFASGVFNITGANWMVTDGGKPTLAAQLTGLIIIMTASTVSAMSGIKRGIKWLSNINMSLSVVILLFFIFLGSLGFALKSLAYGVWDYLALLPEASTTVWNAQSNATGQALTDWQSAWTIFYWAWWIAFAPFVGLFLARVSRGRSVREFIFGAMVAPSLMCFTWFALAGGTAIDLELSGIANGAIVSADISAQLFETVNLVLSSKLAIGMSMIIVVLLCTYLITSADSAILIINTLASGGAQDSGHGNKHIIVWGIIFTAVIAALLAAGGMDAIRSAMIIGAVPFSFVMFLIGLSIFKALITHND